MCRLKTDTRHFVKAALLKKKKRNWVKYIALGNRLVRRRGPSAYVTHRVSVHKGAVRSRCFWLLHYRASTYNKNQTMFMTVKHIKTPRIKQHLVKQNTALIPMKVLFFLLVVHLDFVFLWQQLLREAILTSLLEVLHKRGTVLKQYIELGKGSNNQNGNLRWHLPLGVRPPPLNGTNFQTFFTPLFFFCN